MAKARAADFETRKEARSRELDAWTQAHGLDLAKLDPGQQWVVFSSLQVASVLDGLPPLKRVLGYFLSHSGMDLDQAFIAAIVGTSVHQLWEAKALSPSELLHSLRHPVGGHRKPKLQAHHAGPVAKFLVEHPQASVEEVLAFIRSEFEVSLERHTLQRFFKKYGLGCLRGGLVEGTAPFLPTLSMAAPSS